MVLDRKTNFFLGKTKEKKTAFGKLCGQTPKRWFFWFSLGKSWFLVEKPIFSQEKDGFGPKNQDGFGAKNQLFPRENQKNNFFGVWPYSFPKMFFLVFPRNKLVFRSKPIFFLEQIWFFGPEPSFS